MVQTLLCWRYLRTRWIALASIVSVTLGVATLIVVNSVMDGFTEEMHNRIHGILSDIVVETHASNGITDPEFFKQQINATLGDDVLGITTVVTVPAMLTSHFHNQSQTQQINLIGIDRETYASVSDFSQFLLHPENRKKLEFMLRDTQYAPDREGFPQSGWAYRRQMAQLRKEYDRELQHQKALQSTMQSLNQVNPDESFNEGEATDSNITAESNIAAESTPAAEFDFDFQPPLSLAQTDSDVPAKIANIKSEDQYDPAAGPGMATAKVSAHRFDPEFDEHTGVILGIGIGSFRWRDEEGQVQDVYSIRPGDDVTIALPSAGSQPRALDENFTVVDFYESQMSEYDSTFAFVPIEKLQKIRGMIDPQSGRAAVTSIQIKMKAGCDIAVARDTLRRMFPPETTLVHVNTWRDSQGPLLAAVQMETTILNILLFMIIAVAGFGILATFFMIVVEKTRDIGVLKSLGASGYRVAGIFLIYGLLLGLTGAGVGAVLGLTFVHYINDIAVLLETLTGREVFDPTVYYFTKIPTIVHPFTVCWVVIGSTIIAVGASVLPSIRAARMHPVEALRYE